MFNVIGSIVIVLIAMNGIIAIIELMISYSETKNYIELHKFELLLEEIENGKGDIKK